MGNSFRLRVNTEYLRFLLKRNRRFMVLMSIAMLVLYPILTLTFQVLSGMNDTTGLRTTGQVFDLILLIASAFILPLLLLGYLNSKKNMDVYHALPIKQADLLITNIVASWFLMIIPFTVGWFVGGVVTLDSQYTILKVVETWGSSILIATAIQSIIVFTMMQTGTSLDAFLYSALLNVLPIIAFAAYMLFRYIVFLGFNGDYMTRFIGMIFPIWSLFENAFEIEIRLWDSSILNGVYWFILALVFYGLSVFFYHKRKHERAESPFTNTIFFPVISGILSILLVFLMYSGFYTTTAPMNQSFFNPMNFIFPFFFTGIIYLVMDTISQRSFKNLYKAMLRYLIIALIAFSLLLSGLFTRGFGYVTQIPALNEVASVDFRFDDYPGQVLPVANTMYSMYEEQDIMTFHLEDQKGIQTAIDMHTIILSEYKWVDYTTQSFFQYNPSQLISTIESKEGYKPSYVAFPYQADSTYYGSVSVSFIYKLKNGTTLTRQYSVPYEWTKILLDLNHSEGMLKRIAPAIDRLDEYPLLNWAKVRNAIDPTTVYANNLDLETFAMNYKADFTKLISESIEPKYTTLGYINLSTCRDASTQYCLETSILVHEGMTETLAYLDSIGIEFPSAIKLDQVAGYLLLPRADLKDSRFYLAWGTNMSRDPYSYVYATERLYDYVELSDEQLIAIQAYTSDQGHSETPLMALRIVETISYAGSPNFLGNSLVLPEYADEVMAIIQDNPRLQTTDPASITQGPITKQ